MKILCLQLARFGDIFMTWPVLQALKNKYPEAEIHGLFRERFVSAAEVFYGIDVIHQVPSQEIFKNLLKEDGCNLAGEVLDQWAAELRALNFDLILNFSFSPVSSFLTNFLANKNTRVEGYQRHSDGYLSLQDDLSRYFYAQVGPGRYNRIHLTDLMAQLAQVDLRPSDFQVTLRREEFNLPNITLAKFYLNKNQYAVLHMGASEAHKKVTTKSWSNFIFQFFDFFPDHKLILVGGREDAEIAAQIPAIYSHDGVINAIGQTSWSELFQIQKNSKFFIGADSGPLHLAVLAGTKIVNLSLGHVNFWETGPRSASSVVFRASSEDDLNFEKILDQTKSWLSGQAHGVSIVGVDKIPSFKIRGHDLDFEWRLIESIYLGYPFPVSDHIDWVKSVQNIIELNEMAISALEKFEQEKPEFLGPYLDRIYEAMNLMIKIDPSFLILVNWLRAEKCKVGSNNFSEICKEYLEIHRMFACILKPYQLYENLSERI